MGLLMAAALTFPYADHWLGADAMYSTKVSRSATVWFYGDTYFGMNGQRKGMVRNSVGLQGRDGVVHGIDAPNDFFLPEHDDQWYWPKGSVMYRGKLLVLLGRFEHVDDPTFPFALVATDVAVVRNPKDHPLEWDIEYRPFMDRSDIHAGAAVVKHRGWLYSFSTVNELRGMVQPTILHRARLSDLDHVQYLSEDGWRPGLGYDDARVMVEQGVTEFSVHREGLGWRIIIQGRVFIDDRSIYTAHHRSLVRPWDDLQLMTYIDAPPGQICYAGKAAADKRHFVYVCSWNSPKNHQDTTAYRPLVGEISWD